MPFQNNLFITSPKEKTGSSTGYILIHYIPIVGGYMLDDYEMGSYEWPSMSLCYPLIYTLTAS